MTIEGGWSSCIETCKALGKALLMDHPWLMRGRAELLPSLGGTKPNGAVLPHITHPTAGPVNAFTATNFTTTIGKRPKPPVNVSPAPTLSPPKPQKAACRRQVALCQPCQPARLWIESLSQIRQKRHINCFAVVNSSHPMRLITPNPLNQINQTPPRQLSRVLNCWAGKNLV